MINKIKWTEIQLDGYPERPTTTGELCLIRKDGREFPAVWCDVRKQWLNEDHRPLYTQWKVTHWVYLTPDNK